MKLIKRFSTVHTTASPNRKIDYIVIHYTAGVTSREGSALNSAIYFSTADRDVSADYTVDDVISNVTEGIMQYKTSVVLLHDDENKTVTVEALEPLINQLKQMHADILPIDENTYVVQYIKADSVE